VSISVGSALEMVLYSYSYRRASISEGGKPIIAMASRALKGISKIVPTLKVGAGVVSTRANMHYVVTEYGVAYLYGKSLKQRAKALIKIAHPDDREALEKAAFERWNGYFNEGQGVRATTEKYGQNAWLC
jgi:acyl-CoA hydrolase